MIEFYFKVFVCREHITKQLVFVSLNLLSTPMTYSISHSSINLEKFIIQWLKIKIYAFYLNISEKLVIICWFSQKNKQVSFEIFETFENYSTTYLRIVVATVFTKTLSCIVEQERRIDLSNNE